MLKIIMSTLMLFAFQTSLQAGTTPTLENTTKLYVATFNRAPDAGGLDYWANDAGLDLEGIAQSFFDQPETKEAYPADSTNTDFVEAVYQNLFNRPSEAAGLAYWVAELDSGRIAKSTFILAVINGAQDTQEFGNDATILTNKTTVGLAFANAGLNNTTVAREVMLGVTAAASTVTSALLGVTAASNTTTSDWDEFLLNRYKDWESYYATCMDGDVFFGNHDLIPLLEGVNAALVLLDEDIAMVQAELLAMDNSEEISLTFQDPVSKYEFDGQELLEYRDRLDDLLILLREAINDLNVAIANEKDLDEVVGLLAEVTDLSAGTVYTYFFDLSLSSIPYPTTLSYIERYYHIAMQDANYITGYGTFSFDGGLHGITNRANIISNTYGGCLNEWQRFNELR